MYYRRHSFQKAKLTKQRKSQFYGEVSKLFISSDSVSWCLFKMHTEEYNHHLTFTFSFSYASIAVLASISAKFKEKFYPLRKA